MRSRDVSRDRRRAIRTRDSNCQLEMHRQFPQTLTQQAFANLGIIIPEPEGQPGYEQESFSYAFLDPSPPVGVVQYGGYFRAQYGTGARQNVMYSDQARYIAVLELKK